MYVGLFVCVFDCVWCVRLCVCLFVWVRVRVLVLCVLAYVSVCMVGLSGLLVCMLACAKVVGCCVLYSFIWLLVCSLGLIVRVVGALACSCVCPCLCCLCVCLFVPVYEYLLVRLCVRSLACSFGSFGCWFVCLLVSALVFVVRVCLCVFVFVCVLWALSVRVFVFFVFAFACSLVW